MPDQVKDDPKVTEEQVKTANEAEKAKWGDDFPEDQLAVPYKRDEKTEEKAKDTEEEEENEPKGSEPEPAESYSDPIPALTVEDPGEYKPTDHSFEVTLKGGKTVKVKTPEDAEKLADDPENFETPAQLMQFINKQNKMNINLDRDYDKWQTQKKTFDEQSATETQRAETINTLASEFKYLEDKGLVPKVAKEYRDADWSDPEVLKQPGVKEQVELLNYMVKENEVRLKAGVKPITSVVDALNAWKLENGDKVKEREEKAKAAGQARKAAGARVSGVSPAQQGSFVPKGIAVGNPNVFKRSVAQWDN